MKNEKSIQNDNNSDVATKTDDDKTIVTFVSAESRRRENVASSKEGDFTSNDIPTMGRDEDFKSVSSVVSTTTSKTPKDESNLHPKTKHNRRHKHGKKDGIKSNKTLSAEKNGYQASTAPEDFFKKTYESHFLEV